MHFRYSVFPELNLYKYFFKNVGQYLLKFIVSNTLCINEIDILSQRNTLYILIRVESLTRTSYLT